jgi:hypothetical protein
MDELNFSVGVALGGTLPVWIVAAIIGKLLSSKISRMKNVIYSTAISYVIVTIVSGFGFSELGQYDPLYFAYLASSVMVLAVRLTLAEDLNKARESTQ